MTDHPTTVALVSLGCPKNLVDAEHMLGLLAAEGFAIVDEPEGAEVVIVNTCAFIQPAEEEAIEALLDLADLKREGPCRVLLCTGCLTQRRGRELLAALPEVDGFLGVGAVPHVAALVRRALAGEKVFIPGELNYSATAELPRWRSSPEWLAYLRIADGCAHHCSFCTIPQIRGPYRSRPVADLVTEFRRLVSEGVREVCLIAQDTTHYGADLPDRPTLACLLRALGEVTYNGWLRILYMHPRHLKADLLQAMAEVPAVLPYLDIPLQHVNREVLRSMGRSGGKQEYLDLLANIRRVLPQVAIRSTFITGFPGETEAAFEELLSFLGQARLDRVSAFRYWCEEGTRAAMLPDQVHEDIAEERLSRLLEWQEGISLQINQALVGRHLRVLVESRRDTIWCGRSYRDAPEVDGEVKIITDRESPTRLSPGSFVDVAITRAEVHDLAGELVSTG